MTIKMIIVAYDDNGKECKEGDTVRFQGHDMDDTAIATIQKIQSHSITFLLDDIFNGYKAKLYRPEDVISMTKYVRL